jgi:hypothetical protein
MSKMQTRSQTRALHQMVTNIKKQEENHFHMTLRTERKSVHQARESASSMTLRSQTMEEKIDTLFVMLNKKVDACLQSRKDATKQLRTLVEMFTFVHENKDTLCRYKNHMKYKNKMDVLYHKTLEIRFELMRDEEDLLFEQFYNSMNVEYKLNRLVLRKLVDDYLIYYLNYE